MTLDEAIAMIRNGVDDGSYPVTWADLGCGGGTFTSALSAILPDGSSIYAVDKARPILPSAVNKRIKIEFIRADFEKEELALPELNGILMANSLHYIKNKRELVTRLCSKLEAAGRFIIVEYELRQANPWVPYPVGFSDLHDLFSSLGFNDIRKIGERASRFQRGKLYAASVAHH